MTPSGAAALLLAARRGEAIVRSTDILPGGPQEAYAVQDAALVHLGRVAGWKVGAKGPALEPQCAPLPAACLLSSGETLVGPSWQLRGVEVEVALRLGRDLDIEHESLSPEALAAAFDAVLPVIEVVETRLVDWGSADPLSRLADLQSHGALLLGAPVTLTASQLDLRTLEASLTFDGQPVARTRGGNPAGDVWRLLAWLARHCARRGMPLRAGQIVTTGSCTGMLFADKGTCVHAQLIGIGSVDVQF